MTLIEENNINFVFHWARQYPGSGRPHTYTADTTLRVAVQVIILQEIQLLREFYCGGETHGGNPDITTNISKQQV